jgi:hypothetical protein
MITPIVTELIRFSAHGPRILETPAPSPEIPRPDRSVLANGPQPRR